MITTFLTDSTNNDLYLDASNNIAMSHTDIETTKQLCQNYIQTFLGEIFVNLKAGVDWFGIMLTEYTGLQDKINELTRVLLTVPNVKSITDVQYGQDKETGVINFVIQVQTTQGNSFTLTQI
jgi:hypothetical protein